MSLAGVVAALPREARALGPATGVKAGCEVIGPRLLLAVSGIGCDAAGVAAQRLLDAGATALISWGVAGGLDPSLAAGDICLPREILAPDGMRFAAAPRWREALSAALATRLPVCSGALLTCNHPVAGLREKAALRLETAAVAVDMESSAVAELAAARGAPFVALRVIVDTARDSIPAVVTPASTSGAVQVGRLLAGLARAPGDMAAVLRLAHHFHLALRSLKAVAVLGSLPPPLGAAGVGPGIRR